MVDEKRKKNKKYIPSKHTAVTSSHFPLTAAWVQTSLKCSTCRSWGARFVRAHGWLDADGRCLNESTKENSVVVAVLSWFGPEPRLLVDLMCFPGCAVCGFELKPQRKNAFGKAPSPDAVLSSRQPFTSLRGALVSTAGKQIFVVRSSSCAPSRRLCRRVRKGVKEEYKCEHYEKRAAGFRNSPGRGRRHESGRAALAIPYSSRSHN